MSSLSDAQKIRELEAKIAALEARLAALEASRNPPRTLSLKK